MKKKLGVLTAALILAGCGGGGGELGTSSTSTSTAKEITATVESSFVKGALVCVKGTSNCATTDDKGVAHLRVNSLPVELEVKVGNLVLGDVGSASDTVRINPLLLAEGDFQVAQAIANIIHALGGDPEGESTVVDLSEVEVETSISESIEELVKEGKKVEIKVKKQDKEHTITVQKGTDGNQITVAFSSGENSTPIICSAVDSTKLLLWKMATFLTAADGKKISILPLKKGEKVECTLEVNSDEPNHFKLTNCSNPDYNDDTWEEVKFEDGKLIVEDEDGKTFQVSDINITTFTVKLSGEEDELTVWITDAPALVPQMSQEEINEKLEKGKFDLVYSYLSTKKELTDGERVALAVAVLGKAIKDNLMVPAGLSIISPEDSPFFEVVESGNQVQLKALEEGSKELLTQIERALEELDKVKEPQQVEIPSNLGIEAKTLDGASLKALKALLLYAKSNLEYLLAYNWQSIQTDIDKNMPTLKVLEDLQLKDKWQDFLENSRESLDKALDLMYKGGKDYLNYASSCSYPNLSLSCILIRPINEGDTLGFKIGNRFFKQETFNQVILDKGIFNFKEALYQKTDFEFPSLKKPCICDYTVNLAPIFEEPITGDEIKNDVEAGRIIEVKVCTEWFYKEDGKKECTYTINDILFTKDSSIYKHIEKLQWDYMEYDLKQLQGTYNGKNFYSLRGLDASPEDILETVYPN